MQRDIARYSKNVLRQRSWQNRGVLIDSTVLIRLGPGATLEIGSGTALGAHTILDLLSDPLGQGGWRSKIVIGERVAINEFCNLRAGGGEIRIGNGCMIAQYVSIIGSNHSTQEGTFMRDQPWDMARREVVIGDDVWVGTHAVILPGVRIGSGSVVGAGAVVSSDVPGNSIVGGVPARPISRRRRAIRDAGSGN